MRFVHVLFGGLGGHSAVVFSLLRTPQARADEHLLIFYGLEGLAGSNEQWCREHGVPFEVVGKRPGLDLRAWARIARIIRGAAPDCVFLHQPSLLPPVAAARLRTTCRLVVVEHESNHLKSRRNWLESALSGAVADEVVYLTAGYQRTVEERLGLLAPRRAHVIGNSVDTSVFAPAPRTSSRDTWTFGMHARFVATKDQVTIVRALARLLRDAPGLVPRVRLAGTGPTLEPTREAARALGVERQVDFCGLLGEEALPAFLNSLDAFVLSSFGETMSTSLMQAMACGLPCAGSDVPGVRDMITDGVDGVLFDASDDTTLAGLLASWARDPAVAARLGAAARARAERDFDANAAYMRYRTLAMPGPRGNP